MSVNVGLFCLTTLECYFEKIEPIWFFLHLADVGVAFYDPILRQFHGPVQRSSAVVWSIGL
jgi:hypothetical protein